MNYADIPTEMVTCQDGSADTVIGLNQNAPGAGNVEAFIECFKGAASVASANMNQCPIAFILAQWGGESAWAAGVVQKSNQNFGNIIHSSLKNPPGNIGKGAKGWAKFEGLNKWTKGYYGYLNNSKLYKTFFDYLKKCEVEKTAPDMDKLAQLMSDSGYAGFDRAAKKAYYDGLTSWIATVSKKLHV